MKVMHLNIKNMIIMQIQKSYNISVVSHHYFLTVDLHLYESPE
jgi:hypothetical protein